MKVFVVVLAAAAAVTYTRRPELNFDLVIYTALLESWDTSDASEIHRRTYESIRAIASDAEYRDLIDASTYRRALFSDPELLVGQFGNYSSRPGYLATAQVLRWLSFATPRAIFLVSQIAYVLLLLMGVIWALRRPSWFLTSLVVISAFLSAPFLEAGRLASADMGATLFFAAFLLCIVERKPAPLIAVDGLLTISYRPDHILLILPILVYMGWRAPRPDRMNKMMAGASALLFILAVFAVGIVFKATPYLTLLKHSLVSRVYRPEDFLHPITALEYLDSIVKGLLGGYNHRTFHVLSFLLPPFLILSGLKRDRLRRLLVDRSIPLELAGITIASGVVRFFLLPHPVDRYYLPHFVALTICAILLMDDVVGPEPNTKEPLRSPSPESITRPLPTSSRDGS